MARIITSVKTADTTTRNINMELFCGKRQGKKRDPVMA